MEKGTFLKRFCVLAEEKIEEIDVSPYDKRKNKIPQRYGKNKIKSHSGVKNTEKNPLMISEKNKIPQRCGKNV